MLEEIDDSLTTYDLCSIITHRTVAYAQSINAFWSNHGFPLNLANDPSVTFHLKRGTVYPSNHPLHLATAGASDSALMLALCALQMLVLLLCSYYYLHSFRYNTILQPTVYQTALRREAAVNHVTSLLPTAANNCTQPRPPTCNLRVHC